MAKGISGYRKTTRHGKISRHWGGSMRFFKIAFVILAVIAAVNLFHVGILWSLSPKVYACSEVTSADPINVQLKCKRGIYGRV
jgi:hypothetical protein